MEKMLADKLEKLLRSCLGIELEIHSKLSKDRRTRYATLNIIQDSITNHKLLMEAVEQDRKVRLLMQKSQESDINILAALQKYPDYRRRLSPRIQELRALVLTQLGDQRCK